MRNLIFVVNLVLVLICLALWYPSLREKRSGETVYKTFGAAGIWAAPIISNLMMSLSKDSWPVLIMSDKFITKNSDENGRIISGFYYCSNKVVPRTHNIVGGECLTCTNPQLQVKPVYYWITLYSVNE